VKLGVLEYNTKFQWKKSNIANKIWNELKRVLVQKKKNDEESEHFKTVPLKYACVILEVDPLNLLNNLNRRKIL